MITNSLLVLDLCQYSIFFFFCLQPYLLCCICVLAGKSNIGVLTVNSSAFMQYIVRKSDPEDKMVNNHRLCSLSLSCFQLLWFAGGCNRQAPTGFLDRGKTSSLKWFHASSFNNSKSFDVRKSLFSQNSGEKTEKKQSRIESITLYQSFLLEAGWCHVNWTAEGKVLLLLGKNDFQTEYYFP